MERRRGKQYVTHAELRSVLEPIIERHRQGDRAFAFYQMMLPLGLEEYLPQLLADARVRVVLASIRNRRWKWYLSVGAGASVVYVLLTTVGATLALLHAVGYLR